MCNLIIMVPVMSDMKGRKSCLYSVFQVASLFVLIYWIGSVFFAPGSEEQTGISVVVDSMTKGTGMTEPSANFSKVPSKERPNSSERRCRPPGSESLPRGIVAKTSNLEMRPLWGYPKKRVNPSLGLLALAVGVKQKQLVNAMVRKFLSSGFMVTLFHYDGSVDAWKRYEWSDQVIHISAPNQTKWWFAKRFLHPDIVHEYDFIFLWDEDLGVEDFNPRRYVSIVKEEGIEISQPALDSNKSEVHHQVTARGRRGNVHRRIYKPGECDENSTTPPCTGWIEVMAPVFSRAAWRCVWYMIQNDLIHAWGLDMQLGYCAQGNRTQKIGVIDAEYVVHYGLPTLGEPTDKKAKLDSHVINKRVEVRRQSYNEYKVFRRRWERAASRDECWSDPYPEPVKPITIKPITIP